MITIADLALYAYTHRVGLGGFDLSGLPAVNAWLERVAAEPGHVAIGEQQLGDQPTTWTSGLRPR